MVDFVPLQALANRLVSENGRAIELRKLSEVPRDREKPWRAEQGEERVFPEATEDVIGVFVAPGSGLGFTKVFDGMTPRPDQVVIIQPKDGSTDFTTFDEICDTDGKTWRVAKWDKLQPADLILLYFAAVMR